jgi:hypothetical protein
MQPSISIPPKRKNAIPNSQPKSETSLPPTKKKSDSIKQRSCDDAKRKPPAILKNSKTRPKKQKAEPQGKRNLMSGFCVKTLMLMNPVMQTQREPLFCSLPIYMMIPSCPLAIGSILLMVRLDGNEMAKSPKT